MSVRRSILKRLLSNASKASTVDFSNTREAYQSKSLGQLLRHYLVYRVFAYTSIVDNSEKLIRLSRSLLGSRLQKWLMKQTFYGQFVGGEDLRALQTVISHLRGSGVSAILDYAVEEDVSDQQPVVMEVRKRDGRKDTTSDVTATDPHFSPSLTEGSITKRASARTYFYQDDIRCEQTMEHFLSCIKMAADVAKDSDGDAFAAVKLTGLGRVEFLLRLSEVVVGSQKIFHKLCSRDDPTCLGAYITNESFDQGLHRLGVDVGGAESQRLFDNMNRDKIGRLSFFEWFHRFQPGNPLYQRLKEDPHSTVGSLVVTLSESELTQMKQVVKRAERLAEAAEKFKVRLMIDAEQTYFQPAIRHIAVNVLMPKFNLTTPIIYNTVQSYLKDAEATLKMDLALAEEAGFLYGVKVVRGAYMEQERALAKEKGYEDPIWSTKVETDDCYERLLDILLQSSQNRRAHVMVASHNEHTIQSACNKLMAQSIDKTDGSVVFGQLLGMCDHLTFPLGQAGYHAYKYVPYGPVEDVMPYLLRRAHENKGMLSGALRERELVKKELWRRLVGG